MVEVPGASVPVSLEPILVELEGCRYIGPIFPTSLANLIAGRRSLGGSVTTGGIRDGDGGSCDSVYRKRTPKLGSTLGMHECRRAMKRTYPPFTFRMGRTCGPFWKGK